MKERAYGREGAGLTSIFCGHICLMHPNTTYPRPPSRAAPAAPLADAVPRAGQAMIEMMLSVLMILILVAGAVQFMDVAGMHRAIDSRIRGDTGVVAMSPLSFFDTPAYILNWRAGPDGQRGTADDEKVVGPPRALYLITDRSARSAADWTEFGKLSHPSSLAELHNTSPLPMIALGFVGVRLSQDVPVSDIARKLIYASPFVTVREDVWLPVTKGLY